MARGKEEGGQPEQGAHAESPLVSYERALFDGYYTEDHEKILRDRVEALRPGYKPKELIFTSGLREEQLIVSYTIGAAWNNFRNGNTRNFPFLESREMDKPLKSPIGIQQFEWEDVHGGEGVFYVLSKYHRATNELYRDAREKFIDESNRLLREINRNEIPPLPIQTREIISQIVNPRPQR